MAKKWQRDCPDFPNCPNLGCTCEPRAPRVKRFSLDGFHAELIGNLVFARKQAGMDQYDMAEMLRVDRSQIANIETIRSNINATQINDWIGACRVSIQDIWPSK